MGLSGVTLVSSGAKHSLWYATNADDSDDDDDSSGS